jgi:hypothetical protein
VAADEEAQARVGVVDPARVAPVDHQVAVDRQQLDRWESKNGTVINHA